MFKGGEILIAIVLVFVILCGFHTYAEAEETEMESVVSSVKVTFYGYIKLDGAYDTSRMDAGNFGRWVLSEEINEDDDQFNMTARETRVGLLLKGPDIKGVKTSGKLEIDFYGGGAENKNLPMLRQAYVKLDWVKADFSILAGQTFDIISPLVPPTLNYSVGWWVGDIQYRRPQFRLSKGTGSQKKSRLLVELALVRTIGDPSGDEAEPFTPGDTGEDAGFPTVEARCALYFPTKADKKAMIGVSGHWGQEEWDRDNSDDEKVDLDTWSASFDVYLPIINQFEIKGNVWIGENLDAFLGGIGQGVNRTTLEEIKSVGGWLALS
ncbi:DcaP family trimeric outer membrane transporter, partial [candidate division CSSED10-310 bacterium]